jgi:hypothetical protein
MKKSFLILSILFSVSFFAVAQDDSTKFSSVKAVQTDTLKNEKDTVTVTSTVIETTLPTDSSNYAMLYVYRPKNYVGSFISYDLKLTNSAYTDLVLGEVKNNSKFAVKLMQEGKTEIWAKTEVKNSVNIDVKYGEKYYIKCGVTMGVVVGRPDLNLIYPGQGVLDYENFKGKSK